MRVVLAVLGLFLATTATAQAAYVGFDVVSYSTPGGQRYVQVRYDGTTANERNDLLITPDGGDLLITDAAAKLRQPSSYLPDPPACTLSPDEHTVRCPLPAGAILTATVLAGGGDDAVDIRTATPNMSQADGGTGNDTIVTDGGSIVGGPGDDVLTARWLPTTIDGGDGADRMLGSPGIDLLIGGPGNDLLDGRGGNDTLHDGAATDPDGDDDELRGGDGVDALFSHGGVDRLDGGADTDYLYARDGETAPGSAKAGIADTLDCGAGADYFHVDAIDVVAGCESVFDPCTAAPYPGRPAFACLTPPEKPAPAAAAPAPPPASAAPAPAAAPAAAVVRPALIAGLRLDVARVRPPLTRIPRGLVTLSATADVSIRLSRAAGTTWIPLIGEIHRRVGAGERNISLGNLLGGRQRFVPGRYRLTLTATTADGRTATAGAVLRMLKPKRARR